METFEVEVICNDGGAPHKHTLRVKSSIGALGVGAPSNVRLQYTCTLTGQALIATFKPPADAARPFIVENVS